MRMHTSLAVLHGMQPARPAQRGLTWHGALYTNVIGVLAGVLVAVAALAQGGLCAQAVSVCHHDRQGARTIGGVAAGNTTRHAELAAHHGGIDVIELVIADCAPAAVVQLHLQAALIDRAAIDEAHVQNICDRQDGNFESCI